MTGAARPLGEALAAAAAALRRATSVLVVAHESPDGDALGSTVACGRVAKALGARVTLFNVDGCPDALRFLPDSDQIVSSLPPDARFDVTVLLDCSQRHRAGARFPANGWGDVVVCLDHHVTHDPDVADIFVHDTAAAATGELVYQLAVAAGVALDKELATALYCAVLTDTGSFRYGSTRPESMEIGAALLRAGINAWDVASQVYEQVPLPRLRLLADVLGTLEVSCAGRLATLVITRDMFDRSGADETMTDGFVNYARSVRGVEVAAQLVELGPERYRVNLRSRGSVSVADVAAHFGGGGHLNAAGCTLQGSLADVRAALDAALEATLAAV
ncbi:MAG: bifunctional oligoribonuclease/PAP phosphatase NrnA [Myxococcales bacterium]|nr:bifunctional oligoribonuclease/PAP phosphatase NrnA [Myxococcales bacterium]MCB9520713.1 bifunctional oligoribonuclease/PAP phosphatase NrnA [Myxococcales bacterium]MCB9532117.1 bifunctional oligoribonuclease/PAP phosphatase NrnA [Myxococcales bacterium]